jgi:ABC-type phosphate/phosphonate transport system substrate-binding protein
MLASLPMYDRPETAAWHDALWASIRDALHRAGHAAPDRLNRDIDLWAGWTAPDLLLGQTCGLPYRSHLHACTALIGTFDYGLEGCPPGFYRSPFLAHKDEPETDLAAFANRRFAYNQAHSHSGWAGPQITAAEQGFRLPASLETGGHRASAAAVAEGRADLCAVDAHTWRGIQRFEPTVAAELRVIGHTVPAPGLPLIANPGADATVIRDAVAEGLQHLAPEIRAELGIVGLVIVPKASYLAVPTPPGP